MEEGVGNIRSVEDFLKHIFLGDTEHFIFGSFFGGDFSNIYMS